MARFSANCPICKKKAEQAAATAGDHTEIDCSDCGHFGVSRTLKSVLPSHSIAVRRQTLDRARMRARYGSLPLATTYDLP